MQWTPYEVKRLEYQLRVDAANRCPGTYRDELEAEGTGTGHEPVAVEMPWFRRVVIGIGSVFRRHEQAPAN